MAIWKFTSTVRTGSGSLLLQSPAIVLSDSASDAWLLLRRRLADHLLTSSNEGAGWSCVPLANARELTGLVTSEWPVSLLTGTIDLPARPLLVSLPDTDAVTVFRYGGKDLETELERMRSSKTRNCFALIDGANFPGFAELLEASSLEHECLFRGTAQAMAGAVAPWIIRMQPDDAVCRRLIRAALGKPGGYPAAPTMILETEHSLDEVGRHFRRLTRIRAEGDGRWIFFRYTDPCTMDDLRASMNTEDAAAVLGPYSPVVLHPAGAFRLSRRHASLGSRSNGSVFRLAARHETAMHHRQRMRFGQSITDELAALVPNMTRSAIADRVSQGMDLCRDTGLLQQDSTAGYILLSGLLGPRFTEVYGRYAQILDYRRSETERKTMIHSALSQIQKRGMSHAE